MFDGLDIRRRLVSQNHPQLSELQKQLDDVNNERNEIRNELSSLEGNNIDVMTPFNKIHESLKAMVNTQQTSRDKLVNDVMQHGFSNQPIGQWQHMLAEQKQPLIYLSSIVKEAQESRKTFKIHCGFFRDFTTINVPKQINPIKNAIVVKYTELIQYFNYIQSS